MSFSRMTDLVKEVWWFGVCIPPRKKSFSFLRYTHLLRCMLSDGETISATEVVYVMNLNEPGFMFQQNNGMQDDTLDAYLCRFFFFATVEHWCYALGVTTTVLITYGTTFPTADVLYVVHGELSNILQAVDLTHHHVNETSEAVISRIIIITF